ncbi:hypothetical protein JCM21900_004807 [Sporobolomyces salmonicolor]
MSSYLSSLLGRASAALKVEGVEKTAMPAPFYHSEAIYQLERRAVFSKMWLFACHERLLDENGKFQLYNTAGFQYFVIRDKQGGIRAFHNVCRHRGFPVLRPKQEGEDDVKTVMGKVQILSCGYHGWSYSINGDLVKAPGFQEVPGFENKNHGLLPLRVHVDKNGFVFVNMDQSADALSWKDQFGDFEEQPRFTRFDWDNYKFAFSWSMDNCEYNWKALVDNYNECHHCSFTHPGFVQTTDLKSYSVEGRQGHIAHFVKAKPEALVPGADPDKFAFNFVFPNASHTLSPHYFYTMRICPTGPRTCNVHYDVFRHKDCTDELFEETHKFFVQVEKEDKFLCINTQKGLEMGTYNSGPLHPTREAGVVYFQQKHIETLKQHFEKEQAAGHEIRGGTTLYRGVDTDADTFVKDVEGCSGACGTGGKENEW